MDPQSLPINSSCEQKLFSPVWNRTRTTTLLTELPHSTHRGRQIHHRDNDICYQVFTLRAGIIQSGYGLDDRGSIPVRGTVRDLCSSPPCQTSSGAPSFLSTGYRALYPGRESDHSPQSSAKVKNAWSYTSTPP